ncbi:hypothetical protein [Gemmobacter caeruleus]|uniref:hypothetical protein n=1 Tax=Gemmobacter caeruleus TaxID=2595004 RepID=UPI0011EFF58E|nr:hypothetical protein [Gemmobacter caeruleus]
MIAFLARLFRALFPALFAAQAMAVLLAAGLFYWQSGNGALALVLGVAGLVLTVAVFGALAVLAETNQRAEALLAGRPAPARHDIPEEPVAPRTRGTGRVEPVVSLRRMAGTQSAGIGA